MRHKEQNDKKYNRQAKHKNCHTDISEVSLEIHSSYVHLRVGLLLLTVQQLCEDREVCGSGPKLLLGC